MIIAQKDPLATTVLCSYQGHTVCQYKMEAGNLDLYHAN